MKKYLTLKNVGWVLSAALGIMLVMSAFGKLSGNEETIAMMDSHNIGDWTMIIGLGEITALILFLIPRTMRLGALMLSAYFGGAIMFHMAHPSTDPELTAFTVPAVLLVLVWLISYLRGHDLFKKD